MVEECKRSYIKIWFDAICMVSQGLSSHDQHTELCTKDLLLLKLQSGGTKCQFGADVKVPQHRFEHWNNLMKNLALDWVNIESIITRNVNFRIK